MTSETKPTNQCQEEQVKIIRCSQCEFFSNGKQGFFCRNTSGMAYPGPNDYCSKAKLSLTAGGNMNLENMLTLAIDMRKQFG